MASVNDVTQYGLAANGLQVGSGYDVEIKRASNSAALVNTMTPNGKTDLLTIIDVEKDTDLQALAIEIGNCPYDGIDYVSPNDDGWDELADQWDAIPVTE